MNTSILPERLRKQAVILAGEAAWSQKLANEVVLYLSSLGHAVIGVEVWYADGDVPRVAGWSEYKVEDFHDWKDYVGQNRKYALEVLQSLPEGEELYNLTWIHENEYNA